MRSIVSDGVSLSPKEGEAEPAPPTSKSATGQGLGYFEDESDTL